jgi:hypothetical protein
MGKKRGRARSNFAEEGSGNNGFGRRNTLRGGRRNMNWGGHIFYRGNMAGFFIKK